MYMLQAQTAAQRHARGDSGQSYMLLDNSCIPDPLMEIVSWLQNKNTLDQQLVEGFQHKAAILRYTIVVCS